MWELADAWLFVAIATHERPCTLAQVAAAAQWVLDAVPLETEVASALGKLAGADLVRVFEDWTLELTDLGLSAWPGGDPRGQVGLVRAALDGLEPGSSTIALPVGAWQLAMEHGGGAGRA